MAETETAGSFVLGSRVVRRMGYAHRLRNANLNVVVHAWG